MNEFELRAPKLSAEQIATFEADGFVAVRAAFNLSEMARITEWTQELAELPEEPGKHRVFHEPSKLDPDRQLISRIEYISPIHRGFAALSDVHREPVAQLLGEPCVLFKEKINFKIPGGDGFKPHQDSQAGWSAYADYFINVLVCIDRATVENGCLKMVAGHQHRGLFKEWEPLTDDDMQDMDFVPCPTEPGDIIFFDCYTPHASEANLTQDTRQLFFATYNSLSEGDHLDRCYADKRVNYPPDIGRDPGKSYVYKV